MQPPRNLPVTFNNVRQRWEARRAEGERLRALVPLAAIAEQVLADLAALDEAQGGELLTLARAAKESRYSVDHLGRLVRRGAIPNAGRRGKPLIRRRDLPIRPQRALASGLGSTYDPVADARSLVNRRSGETT